MRKFRILGSRMTAIIMAAVMVVCSAPMTAYAEEADKTEEMETVSVEAVSDEAEVMAEEDLLPVDEPQEVPEVLSEPEETETDEAETDEPEMEEPVSDDSSVDREEKLGMLYYVNGQYYYFYGETTDGVVYKLDLEGTLSVTGTGPMISYDHFTRYPWYDDRDKVTSVVIGEGITSIGQYAFYDCYNFISVTIPESMKTIEALAFLDCSLKNVTIPEGV
ncbi:MAG: leucine-rich repeat domain-containing protein, partial [Lachnospiraceae bacterium]|nr:leucine-rich repeat domain-containing protein [Lachnospiraceae bacterium]